MITHEVGGLRMYWLYFARDFYQMGQSEAAQQSFAPPPAQVAAVVMRTPMPEQQTRNVAKQQADYVVRSAVMPVATTTQVLPPRAVQEDSLLNAYLQCLSSDGEQAFAVWDEEAGFSTFSANFGRITGLSPAECSGHEWIHAIHHTQQYAVNDALLGATLGNEGSCLVQAQALKKGAEARWLRIDVKVTPHNIMVLFRDLSEQKALEEALKQTESALAVSERSRAAFLSSMSHELRTPLNAIMGFSEMMKSSIFGDLGNPTYKEYVKHIHDSGSTLLGKINDLLDIASMESGGITIEEEEFHLGAMLAESIQIYSHHAFERQQQLRLDCPHSLEILGDRAKLMCAVSHLISNALRHSAKAAEVTLSVRVQADDGVILSVRDAGEGISTAQLDIIRNALAADVAYFNIESGGIGLGLSLTKELASRHGGRVMIDSIRHRGTVVSMILPASRVLSGMPKSRRRRQ